MKRVHAIAALFAVAGLLAPTSLFGSGRDSDGSRMQARPIALNATASDRLSPPGDPVDWRYVRLTSTHDLRVTVTTQPASSVANVTVTDAMGKSIERGQTRNGSFEARHNVDPGLYYIAVASSRPLQYTITVR